ncbi:MAG: sensor histidine kinase [Persicimonas sp.]
MRPLTAALLIAGSFLVFAVLYLSTSDELARQLTSGLAEYHRVQSVKGIAFMGVASLLIFGLSYGLLRRIKKRTAENHRAREALLLMERRVMAGTLAASIVHDVKNLAGAIHANLQYMERSSEFSGEAGEALSDSLEAADQLLELNDRLGRAARRQAGEERAAVDLADLLSRAISLIDIHTALQNCRVQVDAPDKFVAEVYPNLVTHAVINLVLNAASAAGKDGLVLVSLRAEDDTVQIVVEDNGGGIPPEQRDAAVEPFSSGTESGTGLGLFSVSYCAERHAGRLVIDDSELGGALIRLELHAPAV